MKSRTSHYLDRSFFSCVAAKHAGNGLIQEKRLNHPSALLSMAYLPDNLAKWVMDSKAPGEKAADFRIGIGPGALQLHKRKKFCR